MGLIRIIVFTVIFYVVYKLVLKIIIPLLFPPRKRDFSYSDQPARKEGDVIIESKKQRKSPGQSPEDGDYVEYEEVE